MLGEVDETYLHHVAVLSYNALCKSVIEINHIVSEQFILDILWSEVQCRARFKEIFMSIYASMNYSALFSREI